MSEIKNLTNPPSKKSIDKFNNIFVRIWIIINILGVIGLFFIGALIFLNPIAWVSYLIMFFPTISLYDALLDWHREKELADRLQLIRGMLIQIAIGIIFATMTIIYIPFTSSFIILDFLFLVCSFIFLISIVFIILFVGYAYFSEY